MYNQFSKEKIMQTKCPFFASNKATSLDAWPHAAAGHPYTNLGLVLKVAGPKNSSIITLPCSDFIHIKQVQMYFQFSCRFVFW